MIHLTTGNRCDVVYTYENGKQGYLLPEEETRLMDVLVDDRAHLKPMVQLAPGECQK